MKELLEKLAELDRIDETTDPTPAEVKQLDEMASMNISMSGESADEVAQLVAIMRGAGADPKPVDTDMMNPPMDKLKAIIGPKPPMDMKKDLMGDEDIETDENWENGADEQYYDQHTMTKDLSGGINRPKKGYKAAERGDNPMSVEEELKASLMAALEEKMEKGKCPECGAKGKKKLMACASCGCS